MNLTRILAASVALGALAVSGAHAQGSSCDIESGSVRILANEFEALQAIAERAKECAGGGVEVTANLTKEHKNIQVPALTASEAEYTVAVVANGSIVELLNNDLIRPLDDLIAAYGQDIPDGQKITVDGKVMAIAFMANAQHLFYREDILSEAGIEPPTTYEEVLEAAKMIEEKGLMQDPFAMNTGAGWNLGEEFVNMYMGYGGELFEPGTANPSINNEKGVQALEMLKALNEYAGPDFLTYDSNATDALWTSGGAAIMTAWGSRAGSIMGEDKDQEIVKATRVKGAPTVGGGSIPASTLWWDGFTIAKNISDEDAEASFKAMMHAISPELLEGNEDKAVWLLEGYEPTETSAGVVETASSGTRPYPMLPYMTLMHTALGAELTDYLQGNESAEQALADVEAAYTTAAQSEGFIQ